jgi:hypothetical protein
LTRLAGDLGELRATAKATDQKVDDMRVAVSKLTDAMTAVVRLDVEFKQHNMAMDTIRTRQDLLDSRMDALERDMPGLRETRGWVVRAMSIVIGAVGLAVLGLVVVKP